MLYKIVIYTDLPFSHLGYQKEGGAVDASMQRAGLSLTYSLINF